MNKAVVLWHNKKKSLLEESILNRPTDKEIEIKSLFSLISVGTERLLISKIIPGDLSKAMRVPYMQGEFNTSFTYGYSLVGKVISGPSNLKNKIVHLMHPHQDRLLASIEDVTLVPDNVSPKLATLASNMETAINAIWDAQIEIGDNVLIIGYGTIGALTSTLLQNIAGVEVFVLEKDKYRQQAARSHGIELYNRKNKSSFDVVFNTTADQKMLQLAINCTRVEGKTIELSWYGDASVNIHLGNEFHLGRKSILCSQVSMIPIRKQPVWNHAKRKELVFKLLSQFQPDHLLDNTVNFKDTPKFYAQLRKKRIQQIGSIINYK